MPKITIMNGKQLMCSFVKMTYTVQKKNKTHEG